MLEKVVREILKVRCIEHIYCYFGDENYYNLLWFLKRKQLWERQLSVIRKYAELLDLPTKFLISIMKLEEIDDEIIR